MSDLDPRENLDEREKWAVGHGYCPDCGHCGFVLGPRGGASINIECGNSDCAARFNIVAHPYDCVQIIFGERIPREKDGGSSWKTESRWVGSTGHG